MCDGGIRPTLAAAAPVPKSRGWAGGTHLQEADTVLLQPRAVSVVRPRPLQHRQVPTPSGAPTRPFIPRAAVLPRPPQRLQVPALGGECTRVGQPVPADYAPPTGTRSPWPKPASADVQNSGAAPSLPLTSAGGSRPAPPPATAAPPVRAVGSYQPIETSSRRGRAGRAGGAATPPSAPPPTNARHRATTRRAASTPAEGVAVRGRAAAAAASASSASSLSPFWSSVLTDATPHLHERGVQRRVTVGVVAPPLHD